MIVAIIAVMKTPYRLYATENHMILTVTLVRTTPWIIERGIHMVMYSIK